MAFNRKAADEIRVRLASSLGDELPHVMTFHALAYALVHPDQDLVYDDSASDQRGQSREVQKVIDAHLQNPEFAGQVRDLMLGYFRDDWERIVRGRFHLSVPEFLEYRRDLPRETLKGEFVKSFGERVIANALFENGIPYRYERNFRWDGMNYRPDFTILQQRQMVVIEYFGFSGDPDYDEMSERKREFWAGRDGVLFLEFTPADLLENGLDGFVSDLLRQLADAGISGARLSETEIWALVYRRAVDSFTRAMRTFVSRCRKANLAEADLLHLAANHIASSETEGLFIAVGTPIYAAYLAHLEQSGMEDFDGLMWRAVEQARRGETAFARDKGRERGNLTDLRFVLVDEFQDFSQMFHELLDSVRVANPEVRLFCVGDDWQAINAFAGSDLSYFRGFTEQWSGASRRYLSTNYRSAKAIVNSGNALMRGRGVAARAAPKANDGDLLLAEMDKFQPSPAESDRHDGDDITPAVLRIVWSVLGRGLPVVLLSRTHAVPWYVNYIGSGQPNRGLVDFLEHVRSFLPEEKRTLVTASTIHGYKGLEQPAVIILDALVRRFPLVHPHWVFLRLFGESVGEIEDEERRLFYVALTRAEESLVLISESRRQSEFIGDIEESLRLPRLEWARVPPAPSMDGTRLQIRVYGAYDVRDQLKALKYKWDSIGQFWGRLTNTDGFDPADMARQPWADRVARIDAVDTQTGEVRFTHPARPRMQGSN